MLSSTSGRRYIISIYKLVYALDYIAPSAVYIDDAKYCEIYEILSELSEVDQQILYRRTGKLSQESYVKIAKRFDMTAEEVEMSEMLLILSLKPVPPPLIGSKTHLRKVEQLRKALSGELGTKQLIPELRAELKAELFNEAISPYISSRLARKYYAEFATLEDVGLDRPTKRALQEDGADTISDILALSGKKIPGVSDKYAKRLVETMYSLGYSDFKLAM